MPNPAPGLGAIERPADRRDFKLGLATAPTPLPAVYLPDWSHVPVKMQGTYGTCGPHAAAHALSFKDGIDLSPKWLVKVMTKLGTLTNESGTDMRSLFQAIQASGDCSEALLPNDLQDSFTAYSDPSVLSNTETDDASLHGISGVYAFTDNPSWDQIKRAIYQFGCVIALVKCGDGWWTNGWSEAATCPLKLGTYASGHFVVLLGWDTEYIYFRNSWSTSWGDNGNGYFDQSYLPYVTEIGNFIPAITKRQQLINALRSLVGVLTQLVSALKPKA